MDAALRAETLSLPGSADVAERIGKHVDPELVYTASEFMRKTLAKALRIDLETHYEASKDNAEYKIDPQSIGKRRLKNLCLGYLSYVEDEANSSPLVTSIFNLRIT